MANGYAPKQFLGSGMKCLAFVSCALLGVISVTGCDAGSSAAGKAWPSEPFAYLAHVSASEDELVVMRGETIVARPRGLLGSRDGLTTALIWTFDGRYVVTRSFQKNEYGIDEPRELVVVDAQGGSVRAIPCANCTSMAPVGESRLLVSVGGQLHSTPEIRQFDLSTSDPPTRYTTDLPQLGVSVNFLASIPGYVLVSGLNILGVDTAEQLFLLDTHGSVTAVGNTGTNAASYSAAGTARPADGKPLFAIHAQEQVAAEGRASDLFLFDPISGARTDTDVTNLIASAKEDLRNEEDLIYYVNDLFWGKDGHLYATWVVVTDDGKWGAAPNTAVPSQLWRLDGTRWIQVSPESVLTARQLNDSARLSIYPDTDDIPGGTLFLEQAEQQGHIANNVEAIVVPG